jgi:hypothetical protein
MKKTLLMFMAFGFCIAAIAQYQKAQVPLSLSKIAVQKRTVAIDNNTNPFEKIHNNYVESLLSYSEDEVGYTMYDLPSNGSTPYGRLRRFADGTLAAVYTRSISPTAYADRGTGYNYFDGTSWGPSNADRIETIRTGWPSVAQLGATGEITCAHRGATGGTGLVFCKRDHWGTGAWTQFEAPPPAGASGILWSRMVTGGTNHNTIHVITLTGPTGNGGTVYKGQDGALVYMRSQDGGLTWDKNDVLPELDSSNYPNFGADNYAWAEPRGNTLVFCASDEANDLILMKSTDNGDTWQKIIVWEHPDNAATGTDSLWVHDGSAHPVIDINGKIHLFFSVYRTDPLNGTWYPYTGGVAYWNEDMPTWTGGTDEYQINCLNPDSLYEHNQLVGYPLDLNGNGVWDVTGEYSLYYASTVGMPQAVIDDQGTGFVVFSATTENLNNGIQDYRHLWGRAIYGFGAEFGDFVDLTGDDIHMFDECVFPSILSEGGVDEGYKVMYQLDFEPGMTLVGDEDPPGDNYFSVLHIPFMVGEPEPALQTAVVSQNQPNPCSGSTEVKVYLPEPRKVNVKISNISGQVVSNTTYGTLLVGIHNITLDVSMLTPGVYFYSVNCGQEYMTKKMIVK